MYTQLPTYHKPGDYFGPGENIASNPAEWELPAPVLDPFWNPFLNDPLLGIPMVDPPVNSTFQGDPRAVSLPSLTSLIPWWMWVGAGLFLLSYTGQIKKNWGI